MIAHLIYFILEILMDIHAYVNIYQIPKKNFKYN